MKTFLFGQKLPNLRFYNTSGELYDISHDVRTINEVVKDHYYGVYECKHLNEKRIVRLDEVSTCKRGMVPEPSLMKSNFVGCPHFYGKVYTPDGKVFEVQQKMTDKLIQLGRQTGGDWTGYRAGEYTSRFLSEEDLMEAFELLKEILINKN